jgi:hypothetical protein
MFDHRDCQTIKNVGTNDFMNRERWGTFSVVDHQRPQAFVAEVMLYDKLIIPVPSDAEERKRWAENGREPDKLDQYLEILGEMAIPVPWDQTKRETFKTRFAAAKSAAFDTDNLTQARQTNLDPICVTRMLLAQDFLPKTPIGIKPWPMAAYPSCNDYREDVALETVGGPKERLAMVLSNQFFVPKDIPGESGKLDTATLKKAVKLAHRDDFKAKRIKFNEWQDEIIQAGNIPDGEAVKLMEKFVRDYDELAKKAQVEVYWKYAFMVIPVALSLVTAGLGAPLIAACAGGLVSVAGFARFDSNPKIDDRLDCAAAAMIHDFKATLD